MLFRKIEIDVETQKCVDVRVWKRVRMVPQPLLSVRPNPWVDPSSSDMPPNALATQARFYDF